VNWIDIVMCVLVLLLGSYWILRYNDRKTKDCMRGSHDYKRMEKRSNFQSFMCIYCYQSFYEDVPDGVLFVWADDDD